MLPLENIAVFSELSAEDKRALSAHLEKKVFSPGQYILKEDLPHDQHLYFVISGSLRVSKKGVEVTMIEAGQQFGEVATLIHSMMR